MSTKGCCVIVGGGPSGLATALTLKKNGWKKVIVVEKRSQESFETELAYTYLLDGRGQLITNLLDVTQDVATKGVNVTTTSRGLGFKTIGVDGKITDRHFPRMPSKVDKYMITRSQLLDIFISKIKVFNEIMASDSEDKIQTLLGTNCLSIKRDKSVLEITTSSCTLQASLVVACDGLNSVVREWLTVNNSNAKIVKLQSPSVGMRYKMLRIKPDFPLPGTGQLSVSEQGYAIETAYARRDTKVRLVLFPQKQTAEKLQTRICANVTVPEHQLWKLSTAEEVRDYLTKGLPQFRLSDLLEEDEIERFARHPVGSFPAIQYVSRLYEHWSSESGECAVLVLGDAAHAFPPDMGAGLNAALEDVYRLHEAFQKTGGELALALPLYEKERLPEIRALCELVSFAFPYQYRQNMLWYYLYLANFMLRSMLSKAAPSFFSPAAFMESLDFEVPYTKVLRNAHATTRNLVMLGTLLSVSLAAWSTRLFV